MIAYYVMMIVCVPSSSQRERRMMSWKEGGETSTAYLIHVLFKLLKMVVVVEEGVVASSHFTRQERASDWRGRVTLTCDEKKKRENLRRDPLVDTSLDAIILKIPQFLITAHEPLRN